MLVLYSEFRTTSVFLLFTGNPGLRACLDSWVSLPRVKPVWPRQLFTQLHWARISWSCMRISALIEILFGEDFYRNIAKDRTPNFIIRLPRLESFASSYITPRP
ncbi:unnamed protein product [Caenorhabditis brenneri]